MEAVPDPVEDLDHQIVLGGEVLVQDWFGYPGFSGQSVHRGFVVSVAGENS